MKEHGSTPGKAIPDNLNRYFDSTLLKPEATERQIENLCREAITDNFFAVYVNPFPGFPEPQGQAYQAR